MTYHCIPSWDVAEDHCPSAVVLWPWPALLHLTSVYRVAPFSRSSFTKPFPWLQSCFLLLHATVHSHTHPAVCHPPSCASLGPFVCWGSVKKSSVQSCTELSGQVGPVLQSGLSEKRESSSLFFSDKESIHYQFSVPRSPSGLLTDLY